MTRSVSSPPLRTHPPVQSQAGSVRPGAPAAAIVAMLAALSACSKAPDGADRAAAGVAPTQDAAPSPLAANAPPPSAASALAVAEDTSHLLWASPTTGPAIDLSWMPAGAQFLVHLRPARLAAHAEGAKVVAALGPWGRDAVEKLRSATAADLAELDAVTLAIVVDDDGQLDACLRAETTQPWTNDELAKRFPDGAVATHGETQYRLVGERAYWLPAAPQSPRGARTLVSCPASLAPDLIDSAGEPPQLVRDLEGLLAQSDADRTATIILSPRFLAASGGGLLSDAAMPLRDALQWWLDAKATATALSADLQDYLYIELRAAPALNVSPRRLAIDLGQRLDDAPTALQRVTKSIAWPAYGRAVIERFPRMLDAVADNTRAGDDQKQAVVNCYLPAVAAHNVLMGAELLLTQSAAPQAAAPAVAAPPQTIADRLARSTSLSFAKDTLQRAVELLSDDLGVPIEIAGRDLQAEGITRNQSFAIDLRDRPGGEILVEILRRANPDRAAVSPADARQKLVYVVEPPANDAPGRIIVTTRAAAAKRGQTLPAEFLGTAE